LRSFADRGHVRAALLAVIGLALLVGGQPADALRHPAAPRCPIFPASNPWNQRVDRLPVAANSDAIIRSIGPDDTLHPDFGSGLWEGAPIGIPITVVRGRQPRVRVAFEYDEESDRGPYPIPRNVKIEGGRQSDGDRHALILARPGGPRPTPPAFRSSPDWRGTTRSLADGSTTPCASRSAGRGAPTSIRRVTSRAARPTRTCHRWGFGSG
jgi:hypothetical protein